MSYKQFTVKGVVRDNSKLHRLQHLIIKHVVDNMRDQGYVPVLDEPYDSDVSYMADDNLFCFAVTVTGRYVGLTACNYEGSLNGRLIVRNRSGLSWMN